MSDQELDQLDEFKADGENSSVMDPVTPAGGTPGKRRADLKKTADPVADNIEDTVKTPQGVAAKKAPLRRADKSMKESVDEIFGNDLDEAAKVKATTVFEAAVNDRVAALDEEREARVDALVEERIEEVVEGVEKYMNEIVEQWAGDNRVAIESSIKVAMAEEFLSGIHGMFVEHNVVVDEDNTDALEEMSEAVDELESALNEAVNDVISLSEELETHKRSSIIEEVTEGMVASDADRLRTMVEDLEYDDLDSYREKVDVVKENFFSSEDGYTRTSLTEAVDADGIDPIETEEAVISEAQDANVARYAETMSRNL